MLQRKSKKGLKRNDKGTIDASRAPAVGGLHLFLNLSVFYTTPERERERERGQHSIKQTIGVKWQLNVDREGALFSFAIIWASIVLRFPVDRKVVKESGQERIKSK